MKTSFLSGLALAATVVACLNSPTLASGSDYVIRHDIGGNGAQYLAKAKRVGAEGRMVVIDGTCASACTFFLHREAGTKFCATPRARLGFHKPYRTNQSGSVRRGSDEEMKLDDIWNIIVAGMPPAVQQSLRRAIVPDATRGGRISKAVWIEGTDAQRAIGMCQAR